MAKNNLNPPDQTEELTSGKLQDFVNVFNDQFFWFKDDSGNINYSNNFSDVTGYSPDELNSISEIIIDDDKAAYNKTFIEHPTNSSQSFEIEYRVLTKDGKVKWLNERVKIFYDNFGEILRMIGRVTDISDAKFSEIHLKENNSELKKQNTAKDSFFNLLSHDLKSPFTSILGFVEILIKEFEISESERNEYLLYIHSSSEKLLRFINNLLDWSRLQTGKLKINSKRINLKSLIYNCVSSLTADAVRKKIVIKVEVDNKLQVGGDERLLSIAITNLISNAIKFSGYESKVYIKVSQFNDELAELIVKDEGVGIPDRDKIRMFKIESMFSTQDTDGEKGTGFGLTLSKEIFEKHSGNIWFYSEEGKGSEFHVTLPSSENAILIIETDDEKRNSLISLLEKKYSNYKIITAENVNDALNNRSNVLLSVIILYHEMPLMNGVQLIETLLNNNNESGTKIISFSDSFTEEIKSSYNKLGQTIFLKNSFTGNQISEALQDLLN